jgi:hypothetical protein
MRCSNSTSGNYGLAPNFFVGTFKVLTLLHALQQMGKSSCQSSYFLRNPFNRVFRMRALRFDLDVLPFETARLGGGSTNKNALASARLPGHTLQTTANPSRPDQRHTRDDRACARRHSGHDVAAVDRHPQFVKAIRIHELSPGHESHSRRTGKTKSLLESNETFCTFYV